MNPSSISLTRLYGRSFINSKIFTHTLAVIQNEAVLEDSLIGYPEADTQFLNTFEDKGTHNTVYLTVDLETMFIIEIKRSDRKEQYKRKVFNVLELTGILGGIFEIFDVWVGFIIGLISNYVLTRELKSDILKAEKQYKELRTLIKEVELKYKNEHSQQNSQSLQNDQEEIDNLVSPFNPDEQINLNEEIQKQQNSTGIKITKKDRTLK